MKVETSFEGIEINCDEDVVAKIFINQGVLGDVTLADYFDVNQNDEACVRFYERRGYLVFVESKYIFGDNDDMKYIPFGFMKDHGELCFRFCVRGIWVDVRKASAMLEDKGYWTINDCRCEYEG